jgi:diguanylate cyclase (GGDEF)-like protein
VVPVVLQMVATAGLISLLSYQNLRSTTDRMAATMQERTSRQVSDYLRAYLQVPQQVIATMEQAVRSGSLDPQDQVATTRYLWQLHNTFPNAPYLNYGLASGDFIGVGQADNDDPRPYLELAAADSIERLEKYSIDPIGRKGDLQRVKPFADFRGDGWYNEPVVAGKAVWTSIYNWVDAPEVMAMGAGIPIRRDGRLVGVAGVDVFLSNISRYLASLPLGKGSQVYLVESNGLLVADSSDRLPFRVVGGRGVRLRATEANTTAIRDSARALVNRFGDLGAIDMPHQLRLPLSGSGALVRVEPFRDRYGLDWRIVVTMPESEFQGLLRREALINLLISLGAVAVSGTLAMQAVRRVNASLTQVVEGSEALATGNLDQEVPPGEVAETQRVAMSLNTMATSLRESIRSLRARNAAVSEEVAQRTRELQEANQRLEKEIDLRRRAEEDLRQSNAELQVLAHTDRLTGVANRNQLDQQLAMEWQRHRREQKPIALLMIDADHFKAYNDCFGHLAGDRCLIRIAEVVQRTCNRPGDLLARFGGEEFVLLLPDTDCQGAVTVAERVQEALEHQAIPHPKAVVAGRVSVSIGIACQVPDAHNTPQELLASADAALYRAKAGGRNRWEMVG